LTCEALQAGGGNAVFGASLVLILFQARQRMAEVASAYVLLHAIRLSVAAAVPSI
jgi:hypothetical protein